MPPTKANPGAKKESPKSAGAKTVIAPSLPHFDFEREAMAKGFRWVAGVDEVGRGPLAGPVGAAAVILDPDDIPDGLDDSKVLQEAKRDALKTVIFAKAV